MGLDFIISGAVTLWPAVLAGAAAILFAVLVVTRRRRSVLGGSMADTVTDTGTEAMAASALARSLQAEKAPATAPAMPDVAAAPVPDLPAAGCCPGQRHGADCGRTRHACPQCGVRGCHSAGEERCYYENFQAGTCRNCGAPVTSSPAA